jgi:hypothetical protein
MNKNQVRKPRFNDNGTVFDPGSHGVRPVEFPQRGAEVEILLVQPRGEISLDQEISRLI